MTSPITDELEKRGLNTLALCKKALSLSRKMEKQNALLLVENMRLKRMFSSATKNNDILQGHGEALENISPLSEAMQDVWNDHVNDTGCFPSCIEISHADTITGTFSGSRFADEVESILKARGFTISRENAELTRPEAESNPTDTNQ